MLEDLLLSLITKLLGPYIAGLTREKLRVSGEHELSTSACQQLTAVLPRLLTVWSGHIVLTDLELRGESLHKLGLPVHLKHGRVGRLQIRVPWRRLRTESVSLCSSRNCLQQLQLLRALYVRR